MYISLPIHVTMLCHSNTLLKHSEIAHNRYTIQIVYVLRLPSHTDRHSLVMWEQTIVLRPRKIALAHTHRITLNSAQHGLGNACHQSTSTYCDFRLSPRSRCELCSNGLVSNGYSLCNNPEVHIPNQRMYALAAYLKPLPSHSIFLDGVCYSVIPVVPMPLIIFVIYVSHITPSMDYSRHRITRIREEMVLDP